MSTENWGNKFSVNRNRNEAVGVGCSHLRHFFFQTEDCIPCLHADANNLIDKEH